MKKDSMPSACLICSMPFRTNITPVDVCKCYLKVICFMLRSAQRDV